MNAFYEHHKNSIRFQYRCFDRILLNGLIQPFQQEQRVVGFFGSYRDLYPVSRDTLRDIATQFHNWTVNRSKKWGAPILDAPEGRRDEFVQPYFKAAKPDQVVCILKAREPARIMTAIGTKKGKPLASGTKTTLGRSIQLLHQRCRVGSHLCADLPVLTVFGSCLPEPASLDCQSLDPARSPLPAIDQCLYQLCRSGRPSGNRGFIDGTRPLPLRPQMAHAIDSILHSQRTPASRRGSSTVLLASRTLRQSGLFIPSRRGSPQRPIDGCQPHHRSAQQTHRHLRSQDQQVSCWEAANRD